MLLEHGGTPDLLRRVAELDLEGCNDGSSAAAARRDQRPLAFAAGDEEAQCPGLGVADRIGKLIEMGDDRGRAAQGGARVIDRPHPFPHHQRERCQHGGEDRRQDERCTAGGARGHAAP